MEFVAFLDWDNWHLAKNQLSSKEKLTKDHRHAHLKTMATIVVTRFRLYVYFIGRG